MDRDLKYRLGDLQLRIMQVLWQHGPLTVAGVLEELQGELAYTTIATMLRKMEDRGLVRHNESARKFIYSAAVSSQDVKESMTGDLVDRLFSGSVSAAVSHLLRSRDVSTEELDGLERLIQEHKNKS
jgi:predicted transcriptional regulator